MILQFEGAPGWHGFDRLETSGPDRCHTENLGITWAFIGTRPMSTNRYHSVVADNVNSSCSPPM